MSEFTDEIDELVERICPILAGKTPQVQSAVLADLLSRWTLGMQVPGDFEATSKCQSEYLAAHMELVMDLVSFQALDMHRQCTERVKQS
jgi:hypothetical protein